MIIIFLILIPMFSMIIILMHIITSQGAERVEGPAISVNDVEEEEEEPEDILKADADSEDIEDMDSCCDEPRC